MGDTTAQHKLQPLKQLLTDEEVRRIERLLRRMNSTLDFPTSEPPMDVLRTNEQEARNLYKAIKKGCRPRILVMDSFGEWCRRIGLPWQ